MLLTYSYIWKNCFISKNYQRWIKRDEPKLIVETFLFNHGVLLKMLTKIVLELTEVKEKYLTAGYLQLKQVLSKDICSYTWTGVTEICTMLRYLNGTRTANSDYREKLKIYIRLLFDHNFGYLSQGKEPNYAVDNN